MDDDLGDPVDHDFFDMDEPKSDRHRHDSSPPRKSSRDKRSESKQNGGGGGDWTTLVSARSTSSTGSRKEIQAKIPTGTPREGDYIYSSDEDEQDPKETSFGKKGANKDEDRAKVSSNKNDKGNVARRNLKSAGPRRHNYYSKDSSPGRHDKRSKDSSPSRDKERRKGDKSRKRRDSYSSDSSSDSDSYSSYSSSDYSSYSDSESEITDVSPLPSPQGSPRRQRREKKVASDSDLSPSSGDSPKHIEGKPPKRPMSGKRSPRYTDLVNYSGVTPNGQRDRLLQGTDARDLSLLLKAVLELDESARHTLSQGVSESSTSKVLFKRPTSSKNPERKNLSFSNDRVSEIDVENQRLLREIMRNTKQKEKKKHPKTEPQRPVMLSHAALNRARDQRRIERDNWNLLKRIESQRPTRYLQRDALLKDHDKQLTYGLQVQKPPGERPTSAKKAKPTMRVYTQSMGSRTGSMSSLRSTGSRPSSGRPTSAKKPPEQARPVWDDRW